MSDWKYYQLKNLGVIKTGKTPPSSCKDAFSNTGVPFVTPKDMNGVKTIFKTERYLSKIGLDSVKNYLVPKNSIAVSCIGSDMGKAYLLSEDSVTNQQINTLIVNKNHNFEFIYYKLSIMQDYLKSIAGGSATPILNKSHFSEIEIELPDLDTQNNFVEKLKYLDKKIQLNTQINQTLEQISQALFKSWFVDFEPVRAKVQALSDGLSLEQAELAAMQAISGKTPEELTALSQAQPDRYAELAETAKAFPCEMVEVDGVEVPKGWEVSTISECSLKIQNGGTPKRSNLEYWENGDISWLSSGEVCNNKVLVQSKEYITDLGLKGSAAKLIPPYSTLVAIYASPTAGKCAFSGFETSTNQAVCAIIPKEEYTFFNYYHLQLQEKYFANQASGSAQQNISKKIIEETPVLIPNKVILKKFNLLAKPIMNKTIENLKENNNLERKRDLLLPKLLNGEVS